MKHTPGPWNAGFNKEDHWVIWASTKPPVFIAGVASAGFAADGIPQSALPKESGEANAHLIAASPRMYAFIEFCAAAGNAEAKAILEEINGR